MSIGTESVVKQIVLSPSAFGPNEIVQITSAIGKSYSNYRELREAAAELEEQPSRSPATNARLGVCLYLLGRYSDAVDTLAHSDGGAERLDHPGGMPIRPGTRSNGLSRGRRHGRGDRRVSAGQYRLPGIHGWLPVDFRGDRRMDHVSEECRRRRRQGYLSGPSHTS